MFNSFEIQFYVSLPDNYLVSVDKEISGVSTELQGEIDPSFTYSRIRY